MTLGGGGVGCGGAWWHVGSDWGCGVCTVVSGETRSTRWCKEKGWPENIPARWSPDSAGARPENTRERERVRCVFLLFVEMRKVGRKGVFVYLFEQEETKTERRWM